MILHQATWAAVAVATLSRCGSRYLVTSDKTYAFSMMAPPPEKPVMRQPQGEDVVHGRAMQALQATPTSEAP